MSCPSHPTFPIANRLIMGMFDTDILPGLSNNNTSTSQQDVHSNPATAPENNTFNSLAPARVVGTTVITRTEGTTANVAANADPTLNTLAGVLLKNLLAAENAQSTVDVLIDMDLAKESNSAIREEFSRTKGCEYIVSAMKTLGDSVDMQWKCCKLLLFLTFKHERNNVAFHRADASQVIVEAMRKFPQDRNMQSYGCGALCNLAFHNAFKVVEAGGVEVVIAAMKNYAKDANVQVYACGCLKALASADDGFKKSIFDSGGAILLVEAQHRFRDKNDKVVHVAHEALQYMYAK